MRLLKHRLLLAGAALALAASGPPAGAAIGGAAGGSHFQRIATFPVYTNNPDMTDETVAEIVAATADGNTLVYTDGELEAVGFVGIQDPAAPVPQGIIAVGGEPTSVAVLGNDLVLVAVNTSASFTETSGKLVVIDVAQRVTVGEIALGGQPDSIAVSPDQRFVAIAIEEERNEELCVGGANSGAPVPEDGPEAPGDITEEECENAGGEVGIIPQTSGSPLDTNANLDNPPGFLAIVDVVGFDPANWGLRTVDLTGLAGVAPSDPEPEYVDIDFFNRAVVSLQENNHVAIVDLATGQVITDFSAGTVDLEGIDATEDDVISLTESLSDVPREPDAVSWITAWPNPLIATANEGDMFGGSRGFSVFDPSGLLIFDTGASFEELAVQHGHYPEGRSENKGAEPEAVEFGQFDGRGYIFVASERGSFVAVYQLDPWGPPRFLQVLPGPLGPEGVLALPDRNLLVVSGEEDDPPFGVRASIMLYELRDAAPAYPHIRSVEVDGKPLPWSALSGMDAAPDGDLLAVWDSFYAESRILRIDPSREPALITDTLAIQGGSGNFDPEGIAVAPDQTLWVASEGNRSGSRLNRLLQVDAATGAVIQEVFLPDEIEACRQAERNLPDGNTGSHGGGFEGLAVLPAPNGYRLIVAQQRGWDYTTPGCESLDDDPDGSNPGEPAWTRIWVYSPQTGFWGHVPYQLAEVPENASWVGLSEVTPVGDGSYVFLERDNRTGDFATLKTLVRITVAAGVDGITSEEKQVHDLIPDLKATNGWITDKPEGVAIDASGSVYVVTDNDGVDDWSGETWFLRLGDVSELFAN